MNDKHAGDLAVAYIRTASPTPTHETAQRHALENYAATHGYQIGAVFIDGAISGRGLPSRAITEMATFAREHGIHTCLVSHISRLGRSYQAITAVRQALREHGITHIIAPDTPAEDGTSVPLHAIIASVAEYVNQRTVRLLSESAPAEVGR